MFFGKKAAPERRTPPPGMGIEDVRLESSICTGEKTIGFYERSTGRLLRSEWVRTPQDIVDFYHVYGWEPPEDKTP